MYEYDSRFEKLTKQTYSYWILKRQISRIREKKTQLHFEMVELNVAKRAMN